VFDEPIRRILVVTDHVNATAELLAEIRRRAESGPSRFRVVVLNPARAEVHLLHPERHEKAAAAEATLHADLPALEDAAGGPVLASVSVRHDPMDAVEEVLFSEPIDEVVLDLPSHTWARVLHQDLPHRLQHHGVAVVTVPRAQSHAHQPN
jgi:hypothetical protein